MQVYFTIPDVEGAAPVGRGTSLTVTLGMTKKISPEYCGEAD